VKQSVVESYRTSSVTAVQGFAVFAEDRLVTLMSSPAGGNMSVGGWGFACGINLNCT
jgi:hypothetical protein